MGKWTYEAGRARARQVDRYNATLDHKSHSRPRKKKYPQSERDDPDCEEDEANMQARSPQEQAELRNRQRREKTRGVVGEKKARSRTIWFCCTSQSRTK